MRPLVCSWSLLVSVCRAALVLLRLPGEGTSSCASRFASYLGSKANWGASVTLGVVLVSCLCCKSKYLERKQDTKPCK